MPLLLTTIAAALIVMTFAAGAGHKTGSAFAAAVFSIVLVTTAVRTCSPVWKRSTARSSLTPRDVLLQVTRLIAIAYLWCGAAFFSVYLGTRVHWQHGWEYGTVLTLIAAAHAYYARRIADPNDKLATPAAIDNAVRMSSGHAFLLGVGLIYLIAAGKLSTLKGDWAANHIFLAGGFAIMSLCVIFIKTCTVVSERPAR